MIPPRRDYSQISALRLSFSISSHFPISPAYVNLRNPRASRRMARLGRAAGAGILLMNGAKRTE
jgi:hypothetical protein